MSAPTVVAVVPTLGASPLLGDCLAALRREGDESGIGLEIRVVAQTVAGRLHGVEHVDRVLPLLTRVGFAAAVDTGLAGTTADFAALVNDDAVVGPGWLAALHGGLAAEPGMAAAQGVVVGEQGPEIVDGWGIGWNRRWQAVQLGHGDPLSAAPAEAVEVFGVSGTAALLRTAALRQVALPGGSFLEPRLDSYYEDVELAARLRAAGWSAWTIPAARARHAASTTGSGLGHRRWSWVYGNRILVLARILGRGWPLALPRVLASDLRDLGGAVRSGNRSLQRGILAGWGRAARRLGSFARLGPPAPPVGQLRRFLVP